MTDEIIHRGTCFCGVVQLTVTGEPEAMGFCHCESCREWSASPVNAFTLWNPESVNIIKGIEHVASFQKTEKSVRKWCQRCGGHLLTEHPILGMVDVYAAVIPEVAFKPEVHVHYQEAVLPVKDGLPKQKDIPADMGGSGILLDD